MKEEVKDHKYIKENVPKRNVEGNWNWKVEDIKNNVKKDDGRKRS